jgi:hypothetical protein
MILLGELKAGNIHNDIGVAGEAVQAWGAVWRRYMALTAAWLRIAAGLPKIMRPTTCNLLFMFGEAFVFSFGWD